MECILCHEWFSSAERPELYGPSDKHARPCPRRKQQGTYLTSLCVTCGFLEKPWPALMRVMVALQLNRGSGRQQLAFWLVSTSRDVPAPCRNLTCTAHRHALRKVKAVEGGLRSAQIRPI
jgi:hypothetical protein